MKRWYEITANKVLAFALLCVAVSTAFVMWMQHRLIDILSAPDWCARAINAEKLAQTRAESALGTTCTDLLLQQVKALANALYVNSATPALCLLVLIVIVVAGGRLKFKGGTDGVDIDVSRDAAAAAEQVADAAVEEADTIRGGA